MCLGVLLFRFLCTADFQSESCLVYVLPHCVIISCTYILTVHCDSVERSPQNGIGTCILFIITFCAMRPYSCTCTLAVYSAEKVISVPLHYAACDACRRLQCFFFIGSVCPNLPLLFCSLYALYTLIAQDEELEYNTVLQNRINSTFITLFFPAQHYNRRVYIFPGALCPVANYGGPCLPGF